MLNKFKYIAIFATLFAFTTVRGQNMIVANPADISDFRSIFVNPAVASFHRPHVALGGKVYHLGFVDNATSPFRQGFASLVLPLGFGGQLGLGTQVQYFNTPLFSQSNISIALAKRVQQKYSFGIKFNVFSKSFNRDNFDLVDQNDPVFRNGTAVWSATFGAGVAVFPTPFLSVGIGVDHINRANISLTNDNVFQPFKSYLGVFFDLGMVQASVSGSFEEGQVLPTTSIGSTIYNVGYVKLGYNERSFQAEAQFRITGPLSLNYSYDYTIFDNEAFGQGSHQLALLHEFDKKQGLPKLFMPEEFVLDFQAPDTRIDPEGRFHVYSSESKLEIIEKKLKRVVDPTLTQAELAHLSPFDIGVLDSSQAEHYLPYETEPLNMELIPASLEATLSKEYEQFVARASEGAKSRGVKTSVIATKDSYWRAAGLRRFLTGDVLDSNDVAFVEPVYVSSADSLYATQKLDANTIVPREDLITLSKKTTTFEIIPVSYAVTPKDWQLVIDTAKGKRVKSFSGTGLPAKAILWDWHDEDGQLIEPGVYTYDMTWHDLKNIDHTTEKKYFTVQKLLRNITIEITRNSKPIGDDVDEINIILKE